MRGMSTVLGLAVFSTGGRRGPGQARHLSYGLADTDGILDALVGTHYSECGRRVHNPLHRAKTRHRTHGNVDALAA